jgi:hypothetical protein
VVSLRYVKSYTACGIRAKVFYATERAEVDNSLFGINMRPSDISATVNRGAISCEEIMAQPDREKKPRRVSDEEIRESILAHCRAAGPAGRVRPEDVAIALLPDHWQTLTKRVRLASRQLAREGKVVILRKGEPVDPDDFRGVYRLRITGAGMEPEPEGASQS